MQSAFTPPKSFTPYADEILPPGFKYPKRYLDMSKGIGMTEYTGWDFGNSDTEAGQHGLSLQGHYNRWAIVRGRFLIPFAQCMDDAAFFDGCDTSGDPKVIVLDLGNKERGFELENFDAWVEMTLRELRARLNSLK